jgi:hypothetical protein
MTGLTFKNKESSSFSGNDGEVESLTISYQEMMANNRLQQYQIEQQERQLNALKSKVESLEMHRATQLGQDKIVGFLVGAIVLSILSLLTSLFFSADKIENMAMHPSAGSEMIALGTHQDIL